MTVNNALIKSTSHEAGVIANEGSIFSNLVKTQDTSKSKKLSQPAIEDAIEHLIESDDTADSGSQILKSFIAKAKNAGIMLHVNDKKKAGKDALYENYEDTVENDAVKYEDTVSFTASRQKKPSQFGTVLQRANLPLLKEDGPVKGRNALLEQYADAYCEFLVDNKAKSGEKMKKIEEKLLKSGITKEQAHSINKEIRQAMRADISARIKESMLFVELSGSKVESLINRSSMTQLIDEIFFQQKLGGWNFGNYNDSLQGTVNKEKQSLKEDLGSFALEELESSLIRKLIKKDHSIQDISSLLSICKKNSKNLDMWSAEIWPEKKENLGFNLINVPDNLSGSLVNTNADSHEHREKSLSAPEAEETTEEKILINRLRVLYTKKFLDEKGRSSIGAIFEFGKVKRGLVRLGIYSPEIEEKVKFEAELVAKKKLIDSINELMLEKASLFEEKCSASDLIDKRIKSAVLTASKLGLEIEKEDLEAIRNAASKRILEIVKMQIDLLEKDPRKAFHPGIKDTLSKLAKIEARLTFELNGALQDMNGNNILIESGIA